MLEIPKVIAETIMKWIISWTEKNSLYLTCEGCSQLKLSLLAKFESDTMTSHKHSRAAEDSLKWRPPKPLLSRQISLGYLAPRG